MWTLGVIRFEALRGFTAFSSSVQANYVQHALIDNRPRLQRIGTNLERLDVEIMLHSRFCVPEQELAKLYNSMEEAQAEPLTRGDGTYLGKFVVESIEVGVNQTDGLGNYIWVEARATLLESLNPLDEPTSRANAFAIVGRGAPGQFIRPITTAYTDAGRATQLVNETAAAAVQIETQITSAAGNPPVVENNFARATNYLDAANIALANLDQLIHNTQSNIYNASTDLRSHLSIVQAASSVLGSALATPDVVAAAAANVSFQSTVRDMRRFSARIAALNAIRF